MPEGPEITITEQFLNTKIKGKYINNLNIVSGRYTHQILKGKNLLNGEKYKIMKVDSKGKFLWMRLKRDNGDKLYLMNTFGLTGRWGFDNDKSIRVQLELSNDIILNFIDPRNFGTIQITDNKSDLDIKLLGLAPDLLKSEPSIEKLIDMIKEFIIKKDGNIVSILMGQEVGKGIGSGIGNYMCAEILYDAKISPKRNISDLMEDEIKNLAISIRKIMKMSYLDNTTGYMEQFGEFMETHRDKVKEGKFPDYYSDIKINKGTIFEFKVYGKKKDPIGNPVVGEKIHEERTTWWVPKIQK